MLEGHLIKKEREKRGLSQEELGNLVGVTKVCICGYEKGTKLPKLKTFLKLIDILELNPNTLLDRNIDIISEDEIPYSFKISKRELELIIKLRKDENIAIDVYKKLEIK